MPKLPDSTSLDTLTPQSGRGIVSYRTDQVSDASERLGQVVARAGAVIKHSEDEEQEKQGKLEYAYAKSALLRGQIDAESELADDQDYATYKPRYLEKVNQAREQAAGMIGNPRLRQMFDIDADNDITRGLASIDAKARAKEHEYGRASLDATISQNMDAALRTGDEATRASLLSTTQQGIQGAVARGYLTPEQGVKAGRDFAEQYAIRSIEILPPREQIVALMPAHSGAQGGFDSVIQTVMSNEGGFTPVDGSSGAPAIYGINAKWHPEAFAEAKRITDTEGKEAGQAYAQGFYKKEYWDRLGIGDLNPAVQTVVMDGAVNHTSAFAAKLVNAAKAGATADDLIAMRRGEYQRLATANPAKYGDSLESWTNRLDGIAAAPTEDRFAKTGTPVDYIPIDKRMEMIRRNQTVLRSDLDKRVNDSVAMAAQGQADPNPVSRDDFLFAYGGNEGELKYQDFQRQQKLGEDINAVSTLTPADQAARLEAAKPQPGAGFAQEQKNYVALTQAVEAVNKQRQDDPVAFAQSRDIAPNQPLDFSNPQAMQAQLQDRASLAESMNRTYGTPLKVMTNAEAKQFTGAMDQMPTTKKLDYLKTFRDGVSDPQVYQEALQQIRPDSPVTAMAGMYLGLDKALTTNTHWFSPDDTVTPEKVASNLIEGEALLNPTKTDKQTDGKGKTFPMPSDGTDGKPGLRQSFNAYVGDAFRSQSQAAEQAYQAYRAYYAAEAARKGNYSGTLDSTTAQEAVKAVIGNVVTIGNGSVIAPWGMDETTFRDFAKIHFDTAVQGNGLDRVSFDDATLENTGEPGTYRAVVGAGYLLDKSGKPITIKLGR